MPPFISNDLKARIPALHHEQGFTVKKICKILNIKKTLAYQTLRHHRVYGVAVDPDARRRGVHRRALTTADLSFIRRLLDQQHTVYLDEIQEQLVSRCGVKVSIPTLTRTLRRLHFTHKDISGKALERNDRLRAVYMNRLADLAPDAEMLMFGDEAHKDERTSNRRMGWSRRGARCVQRKCFVRGKRFSILPILTLDGIIAHDIIEGSVTSERFVEFLRELVLPLTNPYPGPRSVLVLDNCRIHHAEEIRQLVEDEAQCKLVFLPPYSPDYNPIEQAFSSIKAFLRRNWQDRSLGVIDRACHNITPTKAAGYFKASGYIV